MKPSVYIAYQHEHERAREWAKETNRFFSSDEAYRWCTRCSMRRMFHVGTEEKCLFQPTNYQPKGDDE